MHHIVVFNLLQANDWELQKNIQKLNFIHIDMKKILFKIETAFLFFVEKWTENNKNDPFHHFL
jgi:hypothetical protein